MLLLVTLKVITKTITTLIRREEGKCVLTIRMSEMTRNVASVSSLFAIACSYTTLHYCKSRVPVHHVGDLLNIQLYMRLTGVKYLYICLDHTK